jgi:hypothetical protein
MKAHPRGLTRRSLALFCGLALPFSVSATPDTQQLPPARFDGLPGWMAFSVATRTEKAAAWLPHATEPRIAVVTEAWDRVAAGTQVSAIGASERTAATFLRGSEELYGCDGRREHMALFRPGKALAPGLVWLLPPDRAAEASVLPIRELAVTPTQRSWEVAGLRLTAERMSKLQGKLSILKGSAHRDSMAFSKGEMEGSDRGPIDLSSSAEIGVPLPAGAFRLAKAGPVVVVLVARTYEGFTFSLVVQQGDDIQLRKDVEYLYYCAF